MPPGAPRPPNDYENNSCWGTPEKRWHPETLMDAAPGGASGSARLARHEDGEIARGRRHQLLARHHARAQVRHRAATVEHLGRAHQPPGLHGAKVADGDVDGGADLPRRQHGVQRRAHARVGQREHHRAVHHAVRVQVLRRQRQAEHAVAGALRLHLQVDQVGKGMVHGGQGQKSETGCRRARAAPARHRAA